MTFFSRFSFKKKKTQNTSSFRAHIYVFEVKKSISDIPTELTCSGDLENPGQLPVQEVLGGTGDCVL